MKKLFKDLLRNGEPALGMFIHLPSEEIVEVIGQTGYDYLILDDEHGQMCDADKVSVLRACDSVDIATLIRVPGIEETAIKRALDMGASGIVVPNISSAEDAKRAVEYARFSPVGKRGNCANTRANAHGITRGNKEYFEWANENVAVVLLVEGVEGVRNIEEIAKVPGYDAIFLGPVDLSVSLGIPGDLNNPLIEEAMERVAKAVRDNGKYLGRYGFTLDHALRWKRGDADFYIYGHIEIDIYNASKYNSDVIKEKLNSGV